MIARGALEGSVFVGFANLCALASLREPARGTSHAKAQSRKEKPQSKTQVFGGRRYGRPNRLLCYRLLYLVIAPTARKSEISLRIN